MRAIDPAGISAPARVHRERSGGGRSRSSCVARRSRAPLRASVRAASDSGLRRIGPSLGEPPGKGSRAGCQGSSSSAPVASRRLARERSVLDHEPNWHRRRQPHARRDRRRRRAVPGAIRRRAIACPTIRRVRQRLRELLADGDGNPTGCHRERELASLRGGDRDNHETAADELQNDRSTLSHGTPPCRWSVPTKNRKPGRFGSPVNWPHRTTLKSPHAPWRWGHDV